MTAATWHPSPARGGLRATSLWKLPAAFVVAGLFAGAASAETCHWGTPGTTVSIGPHEEAVALLRIENRLANRVYHSPCIVTHDGVPARVTYDPGAGTLPDVFTVEVPEGFAARPDWLLLDDETGADVLIWRIGEGGV